MSCLLFFPALIITHALFLLLCSILGIVTSVQRKTGVATVVSCSRRFPFQNLRLVPNFVCEVLLVSYLFSFAVCVLAHVSGDLSSASVDTVSDESEERPEKMDTRG